MTRQPQPASPITLAQDNVDWPLYLSGWEYMREIMNSHTLANTLWAVVMVIACFEILYAIYMRRGKP